MSEHRADTSESRAAPTRSKMLGLPLLGERGIILMLCYTYFLSAIDRGIVPGAPESFQAFTTKSIGVPETEQSVYFGLLASAYIASRALFAIVFGSLATSVRPFKLIAMGMIAWVVAVIVSGIAYYATSYYLLLVGRALSGVAGATIHCNGMPFVNNHAPEKNRTVWLGGMIGSVIVGLSAGYVYGSAFASSSLGWAWAFFIEALLALPPIICFLCCIPESLNEIPSDTITEYQPLAEPLVDPSVEPVVGRAKEQAAGVKTSSSSDKHSWRDWIEQLKNVPFVLVVLGYTCYTVSVTALTVFSPILIIGMGFYDDESSASFIFGVMMLLCGMIGTVGGAMLLDRMTNKTTDNEDATREHRRKLAVDLLCYLMAIGAAIGLVAMLFTRNKLWFHVSLGIALTFMSGIGPAESVAVIESFPKSRQAMAVATRTAFMLLVGQVPTPLVIGWLKDTWAPLCGTIDVNGDAQLNPACTENQSGLNNVLLFCVLWLPAAAVAWGAAKLVISRAKPSTIKQIQTP